MKQLVLLLSFSLSFLSYAQKDSLQFPQDFFGVYKGDLVIKNSRGTQTIGMEFHLNKTDSIGKYQYMLVYIMNGERQERKYNLIEKNVEKGEYVFDENNGIFLDAKLIEKTSFLSFWIKKFSLFFSCLNFSRRKS